MSGVAKLSIVESKENGSVKNWGEFIYAPEKPWGRLRLTSKPKKLFKIGAVTIIECFGEKCFSDKDESFNSCHFLVGQFLFRSLFLLSRQSPIYEIDRLIHELFCNQIH